jgi:ABC-type nitrate/sulfonate/bicarbonate transport system substrate-binding protein
MMTMTAAFDRRRLLTAGAATLALAAAPRALGIPAMAAAAMPEKIVIGTLPINAAITAYLGDVDYFTGEGLTVELFHGPNGPAVVQALVDGSLPLGDIGLGSAIRASGRGLPLFYPALGAISAPKHPSSRIMVRQDSPIIEVAELKGKKLALQQRGTLEDLGLVALKKTHGIGHEDLDIVVVSGPNQPRALEQGQVDAIYALPPADAAAERRFHARTLINTTEFVPYIGYGTLAMRRDFVDAFPDAAKKVMTAWCKFCRWVDDNDAAAHKAAGTNLVFDEDLRATVRMPYFARNGLPVMPNVWHLYEMLVAGKAMDAVGDPAALFEEAVLEPTRRITLPVLEELGWEKDAVVKGMLRGPYPLLPKPPEAYYADWEKKLLAL